MTSKETKKENLKAETLFIDLETFSRKDIKAGSFRYAEDPTTEILCMAYSFGGAEVKLWHPGLPEPTEVLDHIMSGGIVRSYNVTFEYCIFNYVASRDFNWPKLSYNQCVCTQADCLTLALPATLKGVGEALNLSEQKFDSGKRLINLLSKPRKPTKNKPYDRVTKEIDPDSFNEMYEYCIQDVKTEIAIFDAIPRHLTGKELGLFQYTLEINETGLPIDMPLVRAVLRDKAEYELKLNKEIVDITSGQLANTNSIPKSLAWLKNRGVDLPGYTKGDLKKVLEEGVEHEGAKRFLDIRLELGRTPIKKFDFLEKAVCKGDVIKNNLIFNKSSTGRFASSGFQMQNLPRDMAEEPMELRDFFLNEGHDVGDRNIFNEGISLIRNVIRAKDGYKIVVSDLVGIELRVAAWAVGDKKTLQDFRDGIDQYKSMAASIFHVPYSEVTKDQRTLGKIGILGGQFGAGRKAFHKICTEGWGLDLSEEESGDIIDGFRRTYKKVVNHWYGGIEAAIDAVVTKRVTSYKKQKFRVIGDFLYMMLPSGKLLSYYLPKVEMKETPWGEMREAMTYMGVNGYTRKFERRTATPGLIFENFIQATAAEILKFTMINAREKGFQVCGAVHDELITFVREDSGLGIEELDKIMSINPEWCLDLPLDADGFEGKFYHK